MVMRDLHTYQRSYYGQVERCNLQFKRVYKLAFLIMRNSSYLYMFGTHTT